MSDLKDLKEQLPPQVWEEFHKQWQAPHRSFTALQGMTVCVRCGAVVSLWDVHIDYHKLIALTFWLIQGFQLAHRDDHMRTEMTRMTDETGDEDG